MIRSNRLACFGLLMLILLVAFSPVVYSNEDTQAVSLDGLLSGDTFQDGSGEDVKVEKAEGKVFTAKDIGNNIWLVLDTEFSSRFFQNFQPKTGIFKVYVTSQQSQNKELESIVSTFMETNKPDFPVLILSTRPRSLQSDQARLTDADQREQLKKAILSRVKEETSMEIEGFDSPKTPYGFIQAGLDEGFKALEKLEKDITDKSPLFILPYPHTIKGAGDEGKDSAETLIVAKLSDKNVVKLSDSEKDTEINGESLSIDCKSMLVKVGEHFSAPVGTKIVVVGAPDELGGVNEQEFAFLAVYFRVCRVWGSTVKNTAEAVKKYLDNSLEGVKPDAQVAQGGNNSEPEIFSSPVTGTAEVNTRLNMRSSPWGSIVGKLAPGSKISIVGKQGEWYIAEVNGTRVFVHQNYVSIPGKPASRVAPTPPGGGNNQPSAPSAPSSPNIAGAPPATLPAGGLDAGKYGFDDARYGPLFDIVEKFCQVNQEYNNKGGSDRSYKGPDHWASSTDCSGFVGHLIHKLATMTGLPSPIGLGGCPDSQYYLNNATQKVTSERPPTNPRDKIRPGDIFVMKRPPPPGYGHIGIFMGYAPSGQPIIAHCTSTKIRSDRVISGKVGFSGTRIETMSQSYYSDPRWQGIFRLNGMDKMLDALKS